jgi:hypothetical protein
MTIPIEGRGTVTKWAVSAIYIHPEVRSDVSKFLNSARARQANPWWGSISVAKYTYFFRLLHTAMTTRKRTKRTTRTCATFHISQKQAQISSDFAFDPRGPVVRRQTSTRKLWKIHLNIVGSIPTVGFFLLSAPLHASRGGEYDAGKQMNRFWLGGE